MTDSVDQSGNEHKYVPVPDINEKESDSLTSLLGRPFINVKFECCLFATNAAGNYRQACRLKFGKTGKASNMRKAVLALATAATVGVAALAVPSPAEARWRGGGWGWGPGIAGGLIAGAVIGGLASSAYAYGPGYGYYGGYPAYYGGYPAYYDDDYYGYAPAYYGGYTTSYYAPAYYGPRYRRVVRPAYAYYGGPRYHRWHRHW